MRTNDLSFMAGGYAGQGVKTVCDAFARICSRAGLHVFVNQEYPSNIKGEHTNIQVMVSEDEIGSHTRGVDILLALDVKSLHLHKDEIGPGGALIYDSEGLEVGPIDKGLKPPEFNGERYQVIDLPLAGIARDIGGSKRMINSIGLGAVLGLLRFDFEALAAMLRESLAKLGDEMVGKNLEGARRAYDEVREKYADKFDVALERRAAPKRMVITGNDAVAFGALKAGVKFYASYPMTPSSSVLSTMMRLARQYKLVALLTEDEISAAGAAIGAAFAGVRAMAGTSGGGFCLMSEHLGLAGMAEIPIVFFESQRPGPATGLPTRTEQGDLKFVLSAHQGDFPRIVIAPGDPPEAFRLTFDAFNLADRYQTPVIILSDKHLSESYWTHEPFDTNSMTIDRGELLGAGDLSDGENFLRYRLTDSGISPRTRPGIPGGVFKAGGNEHLETGHPTEEPDIRTQQTAKRLRKIDALDVSEIGIKLHGDPGADVTLVGWGSTKPVILDAMALLKQRRNLDCNFLQVIFMNPFPVESVAGVLKAAKRTIVVENNATGQLASLVTEKTGLKSDATILKWSGRQFYRDELADMIEERL